MTAPTVRPDGQVALRPLDFARDAATVHAWNQLAHVVPWWGLAGPREITERYLRAQLNLVHTRVWIATCDDEPFGYVETYRVADDPLAQHYDAHPTDRGWHVLVGPERYLGSGAPRRMGAEVVRMLFAEPGVRRVVCEPNIHNGRMIAFCERLGARRVAELDLPDKRAALMMWTREGTDA